jgi:nicotinamidase-related amidase
MRIHALMLTLLITTVAILPNLTHTPASHATDKTTPAVSVSDELKAEALAKRPHVPGVMAITLRDRQKTAAGEIRQRTRVVQWKASETAVIICDMWDNHYCQLAAQRVDAMAPRMNRVITAARAHGALIIHAPSGCMDVYAKTAHRLRMKLAPASKTAFPLKGWCYRDPEREPELPVDVSNEPCDDPVVGKRVRRFSKQHDAIKIIGFDGVSHDGQEIFNLLRREGIRNVVLMGVHTNMCVLGRPFGIRQMVRLGFHVALARDLTDAMYDPREAPFVSHTRGTELVVEHIETYWCPSLLGNDLTRVVTGSANPATTPNPTTAGNKK